MEMKKRKIAIILGTRPEIIKLYPIIKELESRGEDFVVIHTNQHYSQNMDKVFFDQLGLRTPDYNLNVGSGSHGEQTGKLLKRIEQTLMEVKPDIVIVQGDTNSVLAGALAAKKMHINVAHVEAGLRSYDDRMPEEHNRIMVDHISDYLFVPAYAQNRILQSEGISSKKIHLVGNTIVDSVLMNKDKDTDILSKLGLDSNKYVFMTVHRPENVDNEDTFTNIVEQVNLLENEGVSLVLPLHPRTKKMLDKFNLKFNDHVKIIEPTDYLDTLTLQKNAICIMTDSGGIQEEACILKVPCITLRVSTERPETLTVGSNMIQSNDLIEDFQIMRQTSRDWDIPFGDGTAAKQIVDIISEVKKDE